MKKKIFKLDDFDSRSCDIEVRDAKGESFTLSLRKFTLMDRIWAEKEFGSITKWEQTIFPPEGKKYSEAEWLEGILKTIHRLIDGENKFKSWEDIAQALECTMEVLLGLQKALLYVLNGSEPLIDELDELVKKNMSQLMEKKTPKKKKKPTKRKTGPR